MANPIFRFRLIHSSGTYTISEPDGWKDAKLSLERDPEYHSLVEKFTTPFWFYGSNGVDDGGVNFIRNIEIQYGYDTDLTIDIDVSFDAGLNYQDIFEGLYDFTLTEENNWNKIKSGIIRNDLWANFFSRKDTPVDILSETDLDGNAISSPDPIDVYMTGQKIQMKYQASSGKGETTGFVISDGIEPGIADDTYLQFDWSNEVLTEIEEKYNLLVATNPEQPAFTFYPEYGGRYRFRWTVYSWITRFSGGLPVEYYSVKSQSQAPGFTYPDPDTDYVDYYVNINGIEYPLNWTEIHPLSLEPNETITKFTYDDYHDLRPGDQVYFYGKMNAAWSPTPGLGGEFFTFNWNAVETFDNVTYNSDIEVTADTTYPETTSDSFFLHDVADAITNRIVGRENSFYSGTFGSNVTSIFYNLGGCNWKYILTKGLQLRQYTLTDKPFFLSFNQWWNGANPIFNLGLGYEVINGVERIRIEEKEYFYDNTISINIDYVFNIMRVYDTEVIFNKVQIGYRKWQSENISGIDDPQTKKTYATRLKRAGDSLSLDSDFMAASLAIETTRRQTIVKSADYKLDNETFIIAINESESSPDVYTPETNNSFSNIQNLLNSDTRYNLRITPARNFKRWQPYIQGCLQSYIGSLFKFVSGEGNYRTSTNLTSGCEDHGQLAEDEDIPVTNDLYHSIFLYKIEIDMNWETYATIRNNRTKAIGISQTNSNHVALFIKNLDYEIVNSKAVIEGWTKEMFMITNTDFVRPVDECNVAVDDDSITSCTNPLETELGEDLFTESGQCITI